MVFLRADRGRCRKGFPFLEEDSRFRRFAKRTRETLCFSPAERTHFTPHRRRAALSTLPDSARDFSLLERCAARLFDITADRAVHFCSP